MTDASPFDAAAARLSKSLDVLEAAIDRKLEIERSRAILTEQVHALDADRSRLAADLDTQTARARRLESVNREIARRLDAAMDNIRSVLDARER